jgi:peptide/nickel transport system substrate-binding protein
MRARRATLAATTAAVFALSLAACSGSASPGSNQTAGEPKVGSTASAGLPTTDYTKMPYAQVKQGGTLTLSIGQLPNNWNNSTADGQLADTANIQAPLLGSGIKWAADGKWALDKNYATSIKVAQDTPTKIDVQINPKAVWSDGTPVTYEDMVSEWKAQNGSNTKFNVASTTGYEDIKSIDEVGGDKFHYTVTFNSAYAEWPGYVYPDLPKTVTADPTSYNDTYKTKMYPSDGPYIVDKVDQNAGVITEVPNPKWWGQKPKLDKVVFRVIDQAGLGQAFANGEVNSIDTGAQVDVLKQAESRSGAVVQRSGGTTYTQLTMNAQEPPLTDPKVRQALFYAINRQQFASIVQKGLGVKPVTVGSNILLPGQAGYANTQDAMYPYSKEKAQQSLKDAGYTIENGKAMKGGKQLTLSIVTPADTPTNNQRAQLIQNYLGQVGIKVTVKSVPSDKYFSDYVVVGKDKNFELTSFSWVGGHLPIANSKSLFYPATSGQNYFGISNDQIGNLFRKASQTVDDNARYAVLKQADEAIYKQAVMVTFTATPVIVVSDPNLVNFGAVQFETTDWTTVGFKS